MHVTWCQMSPYISHSGQRLHACHMAVNVSKQIFMTQTLKTRVCGEANFQLANFHNINFQSGVEWSGELANFQSTNFQLADFQHMTVNVSMHVTWQSKSSCIPHGLKCLHTYHIVVNVSMHVTWCQMSPCMLHGGQCLHTYHTTVNVSMHVTWRSMSPCMSHGSQCLHVYHMVSNVSIHITQG